MRLCLRCDRNPRPAGKSLCAGCEQDVKLGLPLPAETSISPPQMREENRKDDDDRRPAGRRSTARIGSCWFCTAGKGGAHLPRGPLCDRCRAQCRGLREYLRSVCSTLAPLGPEE